MSLLNSISRSLHETRFIPALGRLLVAAIFIKGGFGKLMAPAGVERYIASAGLPFPSVGVWVAVVIELGGGLLLLLGIQTRLVALILAGFTLVTAFIFHSNFADSNQMIHFMKNLAITGGLLQLVAFGGGSLSVDGARSSERTL